MTFFFYDTLGKKKRGYNSDETALIGDRGVIQNT